MKKLKITASGDKTKNYRQMCGLSAHRYNRCKGEVLNREPGVTAQMLYKAITKEVQ